MSMVIVGIDPAKNMFTLHGVDESGKGAQRDQLLVMVAQLPPCAIGMKACSCAHHWTHELEKFSHRYRLMAPKFVAQYSMSGKRGKNSAGAALADANQNL